VKLIGTTSHYVTATLDEGPIIEQGIVRVFHSETLEDMVGKGRDLEKVVLSLRVFLFGRRGTCWRSAVPTTPVVGISYEAAIAVCAAKLPPQLAKNRDYTQKAQTGILTVTAGWQQLSLPSSPGTELA
jgi:hypothetical protein